MTLYAVYTRRAKSVRVNGRWRNYALLALVRARDIDHLQRQVYRHIGLNAETYIHTLTELKRGNNEEQMFARILKLYCDRGGSFPHFIVRPV